MLNIDGITEKISLVATDKNKRKWLLPTVIAVVFILILLILGNALVFFELSYIDKYYPGSRIGKVNLSGLTKDQAFKLIDDEVQKIDQQSVQVKYNSGFKDEILLIDQTLSPDSANDYLDYDVYKTVYDSFALGRTGGWISRLFVQWRLWSNQIKQSAAVDLDQDYLRRIISQQLQSFELKEIDAAPKISCVKDNCQIGIAAEQDGESFDYDEALGVWRTKLGLLESQPIELKRITIKPKIKQAEVAGLTERLQSVFNSSNTPEYYYQDRKWLMTKSALAKIIDFEKGEGNIFISVDKDAFHKWFLDNVSKDVDVEAQNASIQIKDGKVLNLSSHKNGLKADEEKAFFDLKNKVINQDFGNMRLEVSVVIVTPEVVTGNINDLGIKEIIGVGLSNFSGSPVNRRKNIKNGAAKLNGLLIKPGEDFALIKKLLPIDEAGGYFTELVIKDNRTLPEFGGGLCQIGTTVFRAALASGLPILERQNHSYNVGYYLENGLPGVDATIYDPKPDLRFRNDTGNYILIQTRIVGDNLTFEFWGTKDGRVASRTKPRTWGLKNPAPTKLIETADLAPGVKKCTEKAHKGISAAFDYVVTNKDGQTATTTFTSVYKPWQEVCLIGAAKTNSSTSAEIVP